MTKKNEDLTDVMLDNEKPKIVKPILGKRKVKVEVEKEDIVKKSNKVSKKVRIVPKRNFKKALHDFPLLMTRELRRIRWVGHQELNKKFWLTIAFIIAFAIYFAIFKTLLELIFKAIKAMN